MLRLELGKGTIGCAHPGQPSPTWIQGKWAVPNGPGRAVPGRAGPAPVPRPMPLASSAELRGTRRCPRTSRRRRAASPSRTLTRPGTDPPGSESPAEPQPRSSHGWRDSAWSGPRLTRDSAGDSGRGACRADAVCLRRGLQAPPRVSVACVARRRRSILGRGLSLTGPRRLVPTSPSAPAGWCQPARRFWGGGWLVLNGAGAGGSASRRAAFRVIARDRDDLA